jgi:hypothetical protein
MEENTNPQVVSTATTETTSVASPTQAEIEAQQLADKAAALAAAQEKYAAAMQAVALALPESEIRKNDAKVWCYYGVAAGAVLAGTGILLSALKR